MAASFEDVRREGRADALLLLLGTKQFGLPAVGAETWCEVFDVTAEDMRAAKRRQTQPSVTTARYARSAEPTHGTLSAYTNHRCRCDECRKAMRRYNRERRARLRLVAS